MSKAKVIAMIKGGIGNQLFCYAAARRLALANDAELVLDTKSGFRRDEYGRRYELGAFAVAGRPATRSERLEPFSRYRRRILKEISLRRPFGRSHYVSQRQLDYEPRLVEMRSQGTVHLDGYWQSERYFADVSDTIRADLSMRPSESSAARDLATRIRSANAVAMHIRWFDPPGDPSRANMNRDYYRAAVERLAVDAPEFFVFSDNVDASARLVDFIDKPVTLVRREWPADWVDLWLMKQCRHFVIGNSTFAWWGAWLSEAPGKVVVAPGRRALDGAGTWGFSGLIPEGWRLA